jgi:RNA polymerase sigma factor (TIGR02999 family)
MSTRISPVVVGFDFSHSGGSALHRAVTLAARAPFHVLHVVCVVDPKTAIPSIPSYNGVDYMYAARVQEALATEIQYELDKAEVHDRVHFFAIAARMMRRILVDHARTRRSLKRGGDGRPVSLDEEHLAAVQPGRDLVSLDEALDALAIVDPRKGRVVELRFFGGLSVEETAEVLKVSAQTVWRDWTLAKVWLLREMKRGGPQVAGTAGS